MRQRAVRKVKPGNGRPLKRYRWWQWFARSVFHLSLAGGDGRPTVYTVDVKYWQQTDNGKGKAQLYRDGRHHAESELPAVFPVEGGEIEVAMGQFGLKRCHYVTADGVERQLTPDPATPEGHRAQLDRTRPALSRWIGRLTLLVLVVALLLGLPQLVQTITDVEIVARHVGTFVSPILLPAWLNVILTVGAAAASTERALRLRYNRLLDGAAGS